MLKFERTARKNVLLKFGHGKYADFWLFLHIATGAWLGSCALFLNLPYGPALSLTILGMFLYEWWEAYVRIGEDVENAVFDVIGGALGFIAAFSYLKESTAVYLVTAIIALSALCLMILWIGWNVYLKKLVKKNKTKFKTWSARTRAGREHLFRDKVVFFGAMLLLTPLPFLYSYDESVMFVWATYAAMRMFGVAYIALFV
jgi:hypothetical protein